MCTLYKLVWNLLLRKTAHQNTYLKVDVHYTDSKYGPVILQPPNNFGQTKYYAK